MEMVMQVKVGKLVWAGISLGVAYALAKFSTTDIATIDLFMISAFVVAGSAGHNLYEAFKK